MNCLFLIWLLLFPQIISVTFRHVNPRRKRARAIIVSLALVLWIGGAIYFWK